MWVLATAPVSRVQLATENSEIRTKDTWNLLLPCIAGLGHAHQAILSPQDHTTTITLVRPPQGCPTMRKASPSGKGFIISWGLLYQLSVVPWPHDRLQGCSIASAARLSNHESMPHHLRTVTTQKKLFIASSIAIVEATHHFRNVSSHQGPPYHLNNLNGSRIRKVQGLHSSLFI